MEPTTKYFLINLVALTVMCNIDRYLLGDDLENHPTLGTVFGLWSLLSILSIPMYIIWLISTS